jgi:molybdenum cofactor cytidylyltransferase
MINKYGIIILAAGSSSRMGRPKQLLRYNNQSLLQHIVNIALEAAIGPVMVVLGAEAELLKKELDESKIITVINKDWQEGMGSSIRFGLQQLTERFPATEGVIFTVCDQPFITSSLLCDLIANYQQTKNLVIASVYEDTKGTPAFFHRDIFPELSALNGDKGAKQILNNNKDHLGLVSFPMGSLDIDTETDYVQLLQNNE